MRILVVPMVLLLVTLTAAVVIGRTTPVLRVDVPIVLRPAERSGPATLAMVLGCYGADSSVQRRGGEAFHPPRRATPPHDLPAPAPPPGPPPPPAPPPRHSLL